MDAHMAEAKGSALSDPIRMGGSRAAEDSKNIRLGHAISCLDGHFIYTWTPWGRKRAPSCCPQIVLCVELRALLNPVTPYGQALQVSKVPPDTGQVPFPV